jgi:hypothetical protein
VTTINISAPVKKTSEKIVFRWTYIALPLLALWITVALISAFYIKLPPDVIYRFSGGQASRGALAGWIITIQAVFVLIAAVIVLLVTGAARRMQLKESRLIRPVFSLMGNLIAVPQIIVIYAAADIFLYNIYGKTLPALWIFGLGVLLAGGAVITVVFARVLMAARKRPVENTTGSESDARK